MFDRHRYLPRDSGFIQYVIEDWPVRLVALDTLIPGESGGRLCAERLAWLDARLAEAPGRPTIVFMHHPPFVTGMRKMDEMGLDGVEGLAAVIRRHPHVERIACGHLHRPIVRRFAGTVASTCPATAHQLALDLGPESRLATVMEPPACMLHVWLGEGEGLVSHLSVIGDRYVPFTVFDGREWQRDAAPPANFHPQPTPPREPMTKITQSVDLDRRGHVAVLTVNNPPVNALSQSRPPGTARGPDASRRRRGACRRSSSPARAARSSRAPTSRSSASRPRSPSLHAVLDLIESCPKPVVAAIHGTALGGGLEVTLACHYRVGVKSARASACPR